MSLKNNLLFVGITMFLLTGCSNALNMASQSTTNSSLTYELVQNWPNLPTDLTLGNPTGLGINQDNNLVVFHRAGKAWEEGMPKVPIKENPILIIDPQSGKLLHSWGANYFIKPHGLEVDEEGNVWVTDIVLHQVFKFSKNGELLMTLGEANVAGKDATHFNLPTDVALTAEGSFYVSDGYGNSRIAKFAKDGTFLLEWGTKGKQAGQFNTPHSIDVDDQGKVYVADRANNRLQVFDANGKLLHVWQNQATGGEVYAVVFDKKNNTILASDYVTLNGENVGSTIYSFNRKMQLQQQFGRNRNYDGPVARYHDLIVDNNGNIYVGDILGNRIQKFKVQ